MGGSNWAGRQPQPPPNRRSTLPTALTPADPFKSCLAGTACLDHSTGRRASARAWARALLGGTAPTPPPAPALSPARQPGGALALACRPLPLLLLHVARPQPAHEASPPRLPANHCKPLRETASVFATPCLLLTPPIHVARRRRPTLLPLVGCTPLPLCHHPSLAFSPPSLAPSAAAGLPPYPFKLPAASSLCILDAAARIPCGTTPTVPANNCRPATADARAPAGAVRLNAVPRRRVEPQRCRWGGQGSWGPARALWTCWQENGGSPRTAWRERCVGWRYAGPLRCRTRAGAALGARDAPWQTARARGSGRGRPGGCMQARVAGPPGGVESGGGLQPPTLFCLGL